MKLPINWRELGASYSLANLFFIISWKELTYPGMDHYLDPAKASLWEILAIFSDVLLITIVFLVLLRLAHVANKFAATLYGLVFVAIGILAFGPLSYEFMKWYSPETGRFVDLVIPALVFAICSLMAIIKRAGLSSLMDNLLTVSLCLLPFSFIIVIETFRQQIFIDANTFLPQVIERSVSAEELRPISQKVIWVIFDELDSSYLSAADKNNTDISEFQLWSKKAFVATNAFAPNKRTQDSIPSLLTGRNVREAIATAPNDLLLYPLDGSKAFSLRESSNIFTELSIRGGRNALVGWFHPYCRVFTDSLHQCYWGEVRDPKCSNTADFSECNFRIFLRALEHVPLLIKFFTSLPDRNIELSGANHRVQSYRHQYLTKAALDSLQDPNIDFSFYHFSVPHWPFLARSDDGDETHYSALEVANDTLGALRKSLEDTGRWDSTVIIVSSDHAERAKNSGDFSFLPEEQRMEAVNDTRIPFIVKFANQETPVAYEPILNTVISKQLIIEIFENRIKTATDMVAWLDQLQIERPDLINRPSTGRKH